MWLLLGTNVPLMGIFLKKSRSRRSMIGLSSRTLPRFTDSLVYAVCYTFLCVILLLSLAPWFIWPRRVSLLTGENLSRMLCSVLRMPSVNPLHFVDWIMNPEERLFWPLILPWLQLDLSFHRRETMESIMQIALVLSDYPMSRAVILRQNSSFTDCFVHYKQSTFLFLGSTTSLWRWMPSTSRVWLTTWIFSPMQPSTNGLWAFYCSVFVLFTFLLPVTLEQTDYHIVCHQMKILQKRMTSKTGWIILIPSWLPCWMIVSPYGWFAHFSRHPPGSLTDD